ncbi:MAG: dephospho-CoA kinase [Alphaproteobacteria bacterium]|nr:dephospho-CoA kinase [Alphaproteobacteria bacterium]
MLLVGLTGSIGMGKSETARMFRTLGIPVYDADAAVHALYDVGGKAVAPIEAAFPGVARDGRIDRGELGKRVLTDPAALKRLEAIIHPLVGEAQLAFLQNAEASGAKMVVLDIPLLFETGGETRVDVVVVVSAPADVQRERVLAREGMTPEKFDAILAKQTPDSQKRERADFVVETDKGLDHAAAQVAAIVKALDGRAGEKWAARRAPHD